MEAQYIKPCPNCLWEKCDFSKDGESGVKTALGCGMCGLGLEMSYYGYNESNTIKAWNDLPRGSGIKEKDGKYYIPIDNIIDLEIAKRSVNHLELENIVFMARGEPILYEKEIIDEFEFTGLSNMDFILSDYVPQKRKVLLEQIKTYTVEDLNDIAFNIDNDWTLDIEESENIFLKVLSKNQMNHKIPLKEIESEIKRYFLEFNSDIIRYKNEFRR